jgi:hypothetical protein
MVKQNPWVEHVRAYALKNKISYGCAISEASATYTKTKAKPKPKTKTKSLKII